MFGFIQRCRRLSDGVSEQFFGMRVVLDHIAYIRRIDIALGPRALKKTADKVILF